MAHISETYAYTFKDYVAVQAAAIGGTNGIGIADRGPVPEGKIWRLIRYSVWTNSSNATVFELYAVNDRNVWLSNGFAFDRTRREDYTANGNNNIADNNSPPFFESGEIPLFVWTGANNNDLCQCRMTIAVFDKVPALGHRESTALHHREQIVDAERNTSIIIPGSDGNIEGETPDDVVAAGYLPWTNHR